MKHDSEGIGIDPQKLRLLQAASPGREWRSLSERRHCILCEQTISGYQVRVKRGRGGTFRLCCPTPGCCGTPAEWVHADNPLLSEDAWRDWVRLLDTLCDEDAARRKPMRRFRPRADPTHTPAWGG